MALRKPLKISDIFNIKMEKAIVTGITGQVGSYLAEILLDNNIAVHGVKRRSSNLNTQRIDQLYDNTHFHLHYGDLSDYSSISSLVSEIQPTYFYNLAAMSHVRVSFDIPIYTMDITGTGVLRCLEAVKRHSPETRFVQISSSEMYGKSPPPQGINTKFHPRSPYACAKVAGYWTTINYREAYDLFASNAIMFNNECVDFNTPILVRKDNIVTVCRIDDLISLRKRGPDSQIFELSGIEVWDGKDWAEVKSVTATKVNRKNPDHKMIMTQTSAGIVKTTSHHKMLDSSYKELRADSIKEGQCLAVSEKFPKCQNLSIVTPELAEFLGLLVANDFTLCNDSRIKLSNTDQCILDKNEIYTKDGFKKVPDIILNAPISIQNKFLKGFYTGDKPPKNNSDFFETGSSILAQGLIWMYSLQGRQCGVSVSKTKEGSDFYQVNVSGLGQEKCSLSRQARSEVCKISEFDTNKDWVFDIETSSGVFMAGVGSLIIHNSPRRGETFVTRKITRAATRISLGLQEKLVLGNLSAKRDWSHSRDIAQGLFLISQAEKPDDFIAASGEMHSVQEFVEIVFFKLGLNWKDYVEFDSKYLRPAEVDALCGDSSKIRKDLNWVPQYSFEDLVNEMIEHDMMLARKEQLVANNVGNNNANK